MGGGGGCCWSVHLISLYGDMGRRGFGGGGGCGGGGDGMVGWGGSPLFHVFCMHSPCCLFPCPAIYFPVSCLIFM